MDWLKNALLIKEELLSNRRTLHGFAEVGFALPQTVAFVTAQLKAYGYAPVSVGKAGITCTAGSGGKTILLRADMDALPMTEETGLPFSARGEGCHSCGHDCHTAMLLAAAKLLKREEASLKGTVKLMFQPAEELLSGSLDMIGAGILEHPHVDAALGIHVASGLDYSQTGRLCYCENAMTYSGDALVVKVKGVGAHGSKSYQGVDAIHIAAHIVVALEGILAREVPSDEESVVLVGKIAGGTTCNTVADTASLEISIRSTGHAQRQFLIDRTTEICRSVAHTFRGEATVEHVYGAPALVCDAELVDTFVGYAGEMLGAEQLLKMGKFGGGEDFAYIARAVPSAFFFLGAGSIEEGYVNPLHNPRVVFNEDALPVGVAIYVHTAVRWLEEQV